MMSKEERGRFVYISIKIVPHSSFTFPSFFFFSSFVYMFTLIALFAVALLAAPSDGLKSSDINTLISFGDSYTTRNINLNNLTYQCRDCTSAGGPNWVTYLTEAEEWISWDFAMGGAPLNDTLVHKVE